MKAKMTDRIDRTTERAKAASKLAGARIREGAKSVARKIKNAGKKAGKTMGA